MIPQAEIRDLIIELRSATAGVGTFKARSTTSPNSPGSSPTRRSKGQRKAA